MFLMKNNVGNVFVNVDSESRKTDFERLGYSVVEKQDKKLSFSKMKKEELIKYAEEHGIDVSSANTKDEIIALLDAE